MGTSKNNISHTPEGRARPSLLSKGTTSADHNILDAMGSRPDTPMRTRRHWWLLLPLIAATVWAIATQLTQPPGARLVSRVPPLPAPASLTIETAPPTAAVALATPSVTVATHTPSASPSPTPTATGHDSPFAGLDAGSTATAAVPMAALQRDSSARPAIDLPAVLDGKPLRPAEPAKVKTTTAKPSPSDAVQSIEPDQPRPQRQTGTRTTPDKAVPPVRKPASAGEQANSPTRTANAWAADTKKASVTSAARDPDVELLSAIMKHLNQGKGSALPPAPARSAQTIAELVRSCKTHDAIDELLCQRRICEGSWGKAQACPLSQAPQTAKAPSPQ